MSYFYACMCKKVHMNLFLFFSLPELCGCAIIYLINPLLMGISITPNGFLLYTMLQQKHIFENLSFSIMEIFLHDKFLN